jgi:hypothetical protein
VQAVAGERLVMRAREGDEPYRDGEILEVHGDDGAPPYLVRWSDNGHIGLVFPGPGAHVDHYADKVQDLGPHSEQ